MILVVVLNNVILGYYRLLGYLMVSSLPVYIKLALYSSFFFCEPRFRADCEDYRR